MEKTPVRISHRVETPAGQTGELVRPPGYHGGSAFPGGYPRDSAPSQARALATRQFRTMVSNVETILGWATPNEVKAGRDWYPTANDHARRIGRLAGHKNREDAIHAGSGVIAALSPMTEWDENLINAHSMAKTGIPQNEPPQQAQDKARSILLGGDPEDHVVKPGRPQNKTYHFYRNIKDPSDPHFVTIDRHAHDATMGHGMVGNDRGLEQPGRYRKFTEAYALAGSRAGISLPKQAQAQAWGTWKRVKGGKSAQSNFDDYLKSVGDYDSYYSL